MKHIIIILFAAMLIACGADITDPQGGSFEDNDTTNTVTNNGTIIKSSDLPDDEKAYTLAQAAWLQYRCDTLHVIDTVYQRDTLAVIDTMLITAVVVDTIDHITHDTIRMVIVDTVQTIDLVHDTVYTSILDTLVQTKVDTVTTLITDTVEVNNLIPDTEPVAPVDTTVPRDTSITLIHPTFSAKRTYQGKVFKKRFYLNNVYDYSDDGYSLYSYKIEYTNGGDQRTYNEYLLPNRCGELNEPSHGKWNFAVIVSNGSPSRANPWYTMPGWHIFDASDIEYLGNAIRYIIPENISVVADDNRKIENKSIALQVINSNGEVNVEITPKYYMCAYDLP